MIGPSVPSRADLLHAYEALRFGAPCPAMEQLVLFASWARFDARLAEILVAALVEHFEAVNPFALRLANKRSTQPASLATLVEFTRLKIARTKSEASAREFDAWKATFLAGVEPAAFQRFFVVSGRIRPEAAHDEIERNLKPYRVWGFYGVDDLATRKQPTANGRQTLLEKTQRSSILSALVHAGQPFTVNDYIQACGGQIHRRAAERDLRACKVAHRRGFTRARTYVKA